MDSKKINVEVAYALRDKQTIVPLQVEEGTVVSDAVTLSGILKMFPEIDLTANKLGIFGKLAKNTQVLKAGDRVEIYRPLIADPKEVRKRKAAEAKKKKKAAEAEKPSENTE